MEQKPKQNTRPLDAIGNFSDVKTVDTEKPLYQRIFTEGIQRNEMQFPQFENGEFDFSYEWLMTMKKNFDAKVFYPVVVNMDHDKSAFGTEGLGLVTAVDVIKGDGMYVRMLFNDLGRQKVGKSYFGFSAQWFWDFEDENGNFRGPVLSAVSSTNQRFLQQGAPPVLAMNAKRDVKRGNLFVPINLSTHMPNQNKTAQAAVEEEVKSVPTPPATEAKSEPVAVAALDLATVVAKDPGALTPEEAQFLADNWNELTPEDQAKFKEACAPYMKAEPPVMEEAKAEGEATPEKPAETAPAAKPAEVAAAPVEKPAEPAAKPAEAPAQGQAAVENSQAQSNMAMIDKAELASIKAKAAEADLLKQQAAQAAYSQEFVGKFSVATKGGMLSPAVQKDYVSLRTGIDKMKNAKDMHALLDKVLGANINRTIIAGEIGTAARDTGSVSDRFEAKVDEIAKEKKIGKFEARAIASRLHTDLAAAWYKEQHEVANAAKASK